jgi:ankyrin repeat protein
MKKIMKTLSVIFYINSAILIAFGMFNMFGLPHSFGGDAYTYVVNLNYAICYFLLSFISLFIGFMFQYFIKPTKINKSNSNELLNKLINDNDLEGVKKAIEDGADPSSHMNYAIRTASEKGYIEIVKLLINDKRIDPSDNRNDAIKYSSEHGYTEIVELLLQDKRVDPSANNNSAIRYASDSGHLEVVKLLLTDERVDPSAEDNSAIKGASYNKHLEVVKLLLQDERVREKLTEINIININKLIDNFKI